MIEVADRPGVGHLPYLLHYPALTGAVLPQVRSHSCLTALTD